MIINTITNVAIGLALITGFHAYHSTKSATSVRQYAAEQRTGLVKLITPSKIGLRNDTYDAGGIEVQCQRSGFFTSALISYGEATCE